VTLSDREHDLDRHQHRHRLPCAHARPESPLSGCLDGFVVRAECRPERSLHLDVRARSIWLHDAIDEDRALHARSDRGGVAPAYYRERRA
jgi:hypothetical protein